jgi:hypothetical protein
VRGVNEGGDGLLPDLASSVISGTEIGHSAKNRTMWENVGPNQNGPPWRRVHGESQILRDLISSLSKMAKQ